MRRLVLIVSFVIVLLVISGCGNTQNDNDSSARVIIAEDNNGEASGEVKEFTMTAKKWEFEPSTISVNKGDIVKLSINSVDVDHGFAISDFGVDEKLEPGRTTNVEFVADKSGTFTFFCTVFCGSGHSEMKGQLIVN